MQTTNDAVKNFNIMKLSHLEAAVGMSEAEFRNEKDSKAMDFARKIIKAQNKEIQEFKEWQKKHE